MTNKHQIVLRKGTLCIGSKKNDLICMMEKSTLFTNFRLVNTSTFRFLMKGVVGLYRMKTIVKIVGQIQDYDGKCIIHYFFVPSKVFWILSAVALSALGCLIATLVQNGFTVTTILFLVFVLFFQVLNYMESAWQAKRCEEIMVKHLSNADY